MASASALAEAALGLAARGWPVFPVGRNKAPLTPRGFKDATTDPATISAIWNRLPQANIGVATGSASGLTVIDVDGPVGEESLLAFGSLYGGLPATLEVRTGRREGGRHLYFDGASAGCSTAKLGAGLDVRGNGGYVIAPPSIHGDTGVQYEWTNDLRLAPLPRWVLRELVPTPVERVNDLDGSIPQGQRNDTLFRNAASMRRAGMSQAEIEAALLQINLTRCKPPLDHEEVARIARSGSRYRAGVGQLPPAPAALPINLGRYQRTWPAPMAPAAYHGIVGEIVRAIEPTTEADGAAILVQTLIALGSLVGGSAHFLIEDHRHHVNEFAVIVGETAKARKGTSWARARAFCQRVDPVWARDRVACGVSSGEGIIFHVRDGNGRDDAGIPDKRLLLLETEFAQLLAVAGREGNTTSEVLRNSWDGSPLQVLTKNSPVRTEGAHVSLIGHITVEELQRALGTTEIANGFANRIMFMAAKRSKQLPDGGQLDDAVVDDIVARLARAVEFATQAGQMSRDDDARDLWHRVYGDLSEGRPGLFGALTSRSEAHVLRLSMIYALLDSSCLIRPEHLRAALAVWAYIDESTRYIFGDAIGDAVADDILQALRARGAAGMSRTDIRDHFHRNKKQADIQRALLLLLRLGLAYSAMEETEGKSIERWFARNGNDINDLNDES